LLSLCPDSENQAFVPENLQSSCGLSDRSLRRQLNRHKKSAFN
jgi:hypothetical protein